MLISNRTQFIFLFSKNIAFKTCFFGEESSTRST